LPNALEIGEVAKPIPNDDEVLVRIHSASINAGAASNSKVT